MKAGRELDALVAEKVMGWQRVGKGWHTKPKHLPSKDYPGHILNDWDAKGEHDFLELHGDARVAFCGCESTTEMPPYSTDIAAAWELVEKFSFFTLEWDGLNHRAVVHALQMNTDSRPPASAIEDTAPLAICLAALRACGVEL